MRSYLLALVFVVLATATGHAGGKRYPRAQVTFDVPDAWSEQQEGDRFIVADAKKEAAVIFRSLDQKDLKAATEAMSTSLGDAFTELKFEGKAKNKTVNGLKAAYIEGTGKHKGELANIGVAAVMSPTGRVLLVTTLVKADKRIDHKEELNKILGSIKPAKAKITKMNIDAAQVSISVPDDWAAETKAKSYTVSHPSGDAWIVFVPVDAQDLKAVADKLDDRLKDIATELKWEKKGADKKINGLKAWVVEGSGKVKGELTNLWVVAITAPNGKVVLTVIGVKADVRTVYKPVVSKILTSIGPPST